MFNSLQCRDNASDSHTVICVCVFECGFLHVSDKWRQRKMGSERETIEVFVINTLKYIHTTPFPLIIFYFYRHPQTQTVISGHPWAARQSCFITIWFILPTGTMIRKLIVLPSPQRADYRRHNMKHSAEIGNCFFSVNKSIRCTVPGIKHIFQGYGHIFWFRAAGAVTKWSSFGCKNQTRTQYFHKLRLEVVIITIFSGSMRQI